MNLLSERYEIMLYSAAQDKLDGQLFIPTAIKYRALQDDLNGDIPWKQKDKLFQDSRLDHMNTEPAQLVDTHTFTRAF